MKQSQQKGLKDPELMFVADNIENKELHVRYKSYLVL